jgi:hypothetical protein
MNTGSTPLLVDNKSQRVSSTHRHLYWWTISLRGCHRLTDIVYDIDLLLRLQFQHCVNISKAKIHLPKSQGNLDNYGCPLTFLNIFIWFSNLLPLIMAGK